MTRWKQLLANVCFILLFLIGGVMTVMGLFHAEIRPNTLLDVVLTREELADEQKREETLAILKRIPSNGRPAVVTGVVVMALAALGSWVTVVDDRTPLG